MSQFRIVGKDEVLDTYENSVCKIKYRVINIETAFSKNYKPVPFETVQPSDGKKKMSVAEIEAFLDAHRIEPEIMAGISRLNSVDVRPINKTQSKTISHITSEKPNSFYIKAVLIEKIIAKGDFVEIPDTIEDSKHILIGTHALMDETLTAVRIPQNVKLLKESFVNVTVRDKFYCPASFKGDFPKEIFPEYVQSGFSSPSILVPIRDSAVIIGYPSFNQCTFLGGLGSMTPEINFDEFYRCNIKGILFEGLDKIDFHGLVAGDSSVSFSGNSLVLPGNIKIVSNLNSGILSQECKADTIEFEPGVERIQNCIFDDRLIQIVILPHTIKEISNCKFPHFSNYEVEEQVHTEEGWHGPYGWRCGRSSTGNFRGYNATFRTIEDGNKKFMFYVENNSYAKEFAERNNIPFMIIEYE